MTEGETLLHERSETSSVNVLLQTLPPDHSIDIALQPDDCRLFFVLDGIVSFSTNEQTLRVLPREVLRSDGSDALSVSNDSKADATTYLQVNLLRSSSKSRLPFYHRYFSDDTKENHLCKIATEHGDNSTFRTDAKAELRLATLKKYDTVVLQRPENEQVYAVTLRGTVMAGDQVLPALTAANLGSESSIMITGKNDSEVLTIRIK